ncbi:MAG: hypothetical protein HKN29_11715 [Rhodothermales bacterium]|nr:hypothetical protein [Rhodothermales bacterium]
MNAPSDAIEKAMAEIEAAARLTRQGKPSEAKERPGKRRWLRNLLIGAVALLLPFWVLILGSTVAAEQLDLGPWTSLVVAMLATSLLVTLYAGWFARRIGVSGGWWIPRIGFAVVLAFSVYGLVFISPSQLKRPELQETYTALHPVLRLSLATLILVDSGVMVTDGARVPEDYAAMGLPVNQRSLHYPQDSGFVHAVDLRTRGRPEWLTALTTLYLRSVGLSVLRHTGTADHLHVYLPAG